MEKLTPTAWQRLVLLVSEAFDLALLGGRGAGKTLCLLLLALRFSETFQGARSLFIRRTFPGLLDAEQMAREMFFALYGDAARFNGAEHIWRLPNGGTIQFDQLDEPASWRKHTGRSFGLLLVDEAQQYEAPALIDRLRSGLRTPAGVPTRTVLAGNPGDVGSAWLARRYVFPSQPWVPHLDPATGREFVFCPSTYKDNEAIDRDDYGRSLLASTATDLELRRAWIEGSWTAATGAYFAAVLDEARCALEPSAWSPETFREQRRSVQRAWSPFLAHDFGVSAPSVTLLCLQSPGTKGPDGHFYPRGSVLLVDELATHEPGNLTRGLGWTVPRLAGEIKELCERWDVEPNGVADDACFASARGYGAASIADEFAAAGVAFRPARKADRRSGWERMRRLLADAGTPDRAGLYASRRCTYFWETVPFLPRDPRRLDDVDSRAADHCADCARYAVLGSSHGAGIVRMGDSEHARESLEHLAELERAEGALSIDHWIERRHGGEKGHEHGPVHRG